MDTIKILPYLLATFLVLEFLEHKLSQKSQILLAKNKKFGPIIGGLLGALPQCGFSAMASNLFSGRVITKGTLIAIFLSTSDEMLPIMIGEQVDAMVILKIISFKILIGIAVGIGVDLIYRKKEVTKKIEIDKLCKNEHCDCEHHGIFRSSVIHTLKIGSFVLVANLLINVAIFNIGENSLANILLDRNLSTYFLAGLIGLIPNCAGSIIITELYLSGIITIGTMLTGLLASSGLGMLLLFKANKNLKENISILAIVYCVGVAIGMLVDGCFVF